MGVGRIPVRTWCGHPSVHPLFRDRTPHPAPRVFDVAGIPGDDVDVQVQHRLAGGRSHVDADVVAGGTNGMCFLWKWSLLGKLNSIKSVSYVSGLIMKGF